MRLPRPYIPTDTRIRVAGRQLGYPSDHVEHVIENAKRPGHWGRVLTTYLGLLADKLGCDVKQLQLDHDPALENRRQIWRLGVFINYDPPANDPGHLFYREKHAHHIKTNVRGDGAQYPDRVLAQRERRRKRKALANANTIGRNGSCNLVQHGGSKCVIA